MSVTFLVDVDNTLVDNDRIREHMRGRMAEVVGAGERERYWEIQERRFVELGYRDYLGAAQEWWETGGHDPAGLALAACLLELPYRDFVHPSAPDVLARLRSLGPTVVLTDGEAVFQPHKIRRSGLWDAVAGHVLVYVHKELALDDIERRYPSARYVLVDDKPRILAAAKSHWGERVTTVLPRQGQFAGEAAAVPPDITVERIADLLDVTFS
jgi:FMN phosphatase YigB (HAD superfamily)